MGENDLLEPKRRHWSTFQPSPTATYRMQAGDLTAWWRWVNPVRHQDGGRPDRF